MITMKQLNRLPTKIQMAFCNYTAVQNGLRSYVIADILSLIDNKVYDRLYKL